MSNRLTTVWRLAAAIAILTTMAMPAAAQDEAQAGPMPADWQLAISGQIEALRTGQDAVALYYAGRSFQRSLRNPAVFVEWVRNSGYGPIIDSTAHEFGTFDLVGEKAVVQVVRLSGKDLHSYEALYQLGLEAGGWRINGVVLREMPGMNI
ncbi:MAG TPA: DUF4864 domain-containing protein [Devosiaceae bacterium]|nr:DUF4864 domain-containing protein [Devosiaceae bacterium]